MGILSILCPAREERSRFHLQTESEEEIIQSTNPITINKEYHLKKTQVVFAVACAVVLFAAGPATAQEQSADNIFVATVQKMRMPEGGRNVERDSLLQLYHEQVTKKNTHIISQRALQHLYGADNRDLVWITEYKDWASVEAATKMDTELFERYWKDAESRRQFNRMLNKYFAEHSDELYSERTKLRK